MSNCVNIFNAYVEWLDFFDKKVIKGIELGLKLRKIVEISIICGFSGLLWS